MLSSSGIHQDGVVIHLLLEYRGFYIAIFTLHLNYSKIDGDSYIARLYQRLIQYRIAGLNLH